MLHLHELKLPIKLRDLLEQLNTCPHDVDLLHWDYDEEYATMSELSLNDFTQEGFENFKVALDMEVVKLKTEGETWISVFVKGAHRSHVESLSLSHAGYCSAENYDKWFKDNKQRVVQ